MKTIAQISDAIEPSQKLRNYNPSVHATDNLDPLQAEDSLKDKPALIIDFPVGYGMGTRAECPSLESMQLDSNADITDTDLADLEPNTVVLTPDGRKFSIEEMDGIKTAQLCL